MAQVPVNVVIKSKSEDFNNFTCNGNFKNGNECTGRTNGTHSPTYCSRHFKGNATYGFAFITHDEASILSLCREFNLLNSTVQHLSKQIQRIRQQENDDITIDNEEKTAPYLTDEAVEDLTEGVKTL